PFDFSDFVGQAPQGGRYEYRAASPEDLQDLFGDDQPFSDFFTTFFGGQASGAGARAPRPRPGADLESPIGGSLGEAYTGTIRMLELQLADGQTRRIEVKMPPGVGDGTRIRIAGQGSPGRAGGPPGDLYLVTLVLPDARFERDGDDLRTRVSAGLT